MQVQIKVTEKQHNEGGVDNKRYLLSEKLMFFHFYVIMWLKLRISSLKKYIFGNLLKIYHVFKNMSLCPA